MLNVVSVYATSAQKINGNCKSILLKFFLDIFAGGIKNWSMLLLIKVDLGFCMINLYTKYHCNLCSFWKIKLTRICWWINRQTDGLSVAKEQGHNKKSKYYIKFVFFSKMNPIVSHVFTDCVRIFDKNFFNNYAC